MGQPLQASPDLSRLTLEEKDALILALLDRIAALEAKLGEPPKTPDNSACRRAMAGRRTVRRERSGPAASGRELGSRAPAPPLRTGPSRAMPSAAAIAA